MRKRLFHNWILKLSSVICAMALWGIVYTITDPIETKRLTNVPVTFINTEIIEDNNQVYQVLDDSDVIRSLTLEASRSTINDLRDSDINVVADFSKLKMDGTIDLRIYSDRHNDAITFKPSASEVKLLVEDKVSRDIILTAEAIGELQEGYIVNTIKAQQNRIRITGAESVVNSVERAVAVTDVTGSAENISSYVEISLYDDAGEEVSKENITMSTKSVSVTVEILATKTVPIYYVPSGKPDEGFVAAQEGTSEAQQLLIAGKSEELEKITEIVVSGEALSVEGASADVVCVADLDDYLPSGIVRADKQGNGKVEVTFQIAPIINKEIIMKAEAVTMENIPEGFTVDFVDRKEEFIVIVCGADFLVEKLKDSDIHAYIDVMGQLEETGVRTLRDEGYYVLYPQFKADEGVEVTSSGVISIIANKLED